MTLAQRLWIREHRFVFLVCALPFVYMVYQGYLSVRGMPNVLGSDPGKTLTRMSGLWALRFLLLTLFVSPLRNLFDFQSLARYRRLFGLYTFFYASSHLLSYLTFLLQWRPGDLWADFLERPYISVGILAYVLLIPLALTSSTWMIRRLKRRWKTLHRLVYAIIMLALIHLVWQTRSDFSQAFLYSALSVLALGYRVVVAARRVLKQHRLRKAAGIMKSG